MFNILKVSNNINPKKFAVNNEGKLEIEWSEGDHVSYYDQNWLRENSKKNVDLIELEYRLDEYQILDF